MEKDRYLLGSVDNALWLLEVLSEQEEFTATELSEKTGLSKSTVFRTLYTLERRKFVVKTSEAKYRLGIRLAYLGGLAIERQDMVSTCRPFLKALRDRCRETTHLAILDEEGYTVFIYKEQGANSIQMNSRIGLRQAGYCTCNGKALLSALPEKELTRIIANYDFMAYTPHTIRNAENLRRELEEIRRVGYAQNNEESEEGLVCFGAPVQDYRGRYIAAVSISGPAARMNAERETMIQMVKDAAREISAAFGYAGNE